MKFIPIKDNNTTMINKVLEELYHQIESVNTTVKKIDTSVSDLKKTVIVSESPTSVSSVASTALIAPTNLSGTTGADEETVNLVDAYLELTWDKVPNAKSYELRYRKNGGTEYEFVTVNPPMELTENTITHRIGKLQCGIAYNWGVRAVSTTSSDWASGTNVTAWSPTIYISQSATNPRIIIDTLTILYKTAATVDVDASYLVLNHASGYTYGVSSVNLTLDISTSGANGLDTGSEAINTWYYIWVIYNPTTSTTAGLFSVSSTSPTMPSGYTYKGLFGAIRNDASSNFQPISQLGSYVACSNYLVVNGGAETTYSKVDITNYIPSTSIRFSGSAAATTGHTLYLGGTYGEIFFTQDVYSPFVLASDGAGSFYYKVDAGGAGYVYVSGWQY